MQDKSKRLLELGATELASIEGIRMFIYNDKILNQNGNTCFNTLGDFIEKYIIRLGSSNVYEENLTDPLINIVKNIGNIWIPQLKELKKPKNKTHSFEVAIDLETNEILTGQDNLTKYNLLNTKINRKEEAIINIRELCDFLATEEAQAKNIYFDPVKDKGKYEELYKKNYKSILQFRSM